MPTQIISGSVFPIINQVQLLQKSHHTVVVALDGRSGVGKSTLAQELAAKIGGIVIDTDGFYSGPPQGDENLWQTLSVEQRITQVLDYQRLIKEVIAPLLAGQVAKYHPFDFVSNKGLSAQIIEVQPTPIVIIDGVYSGLNLAKIADVKILLTYPDPARRERLIQREGAAFMKDWHQRWDQVEDVYFDEMISADDFDFVYEGGTDAARPAI